MKNIVITGTSRGIGFELVKQFASEGHTVLALSRNEKSVSDLQLKTVTALSCDLTEVSHYRKIRQAIADWETVDVLINNAGVILNKPFLETTAEDFEAIYKINVFAVAELTRLIVPKMPKDGHVVTIGSMGGVQGSTKFPGLSAYSSSKGAVLTLTELCAEEFKEIGPSFNVLAIGAVQTEMLAAAFPGYRAPLQPDQMAAYIKDFALTGHGFYNGKVLQVSSLTP